MFYSAFSDELVKIAGYKGAITSHVNKPDWGRFELEMQDQKFREAVLRHKKADPKLKKYVGEIGQHLAANPVGTVPGNKGATYEIRKTKTGRVTCTCPSWRYVHSHKGTDCKHVASYKKSH